MLCTRRQRSAQLFHPKNDIHGPPRRQLVKGLIFHSCMLLRFSILYLCFLLHLTTCLVLFSRARLSYFFNKRNNVGKIYPENTSRSRHHAIKREHVGMEGIQKGKNAVSRWRTEKSIVGMNDG